MKKWFSVILVLVFMGCDSDDLGGGAAQLDLVTGLMARSSAQEPATVLGNPNVRNGNLFHIAPNPSTDNVVLFATENIDQAWIVAGKPLRKYKEVDFTTLLDASLYTDAEIAGKALKSYPDLNSQQVMLNVGELAAGYYRVFVKINGQLYWENLYFSADGSTDLQTLVNFWSE